MVLAPHDVEDYNLLTVPHDRLVGPFPGMKKLRVAFLTFEFVTEWASGGGLGSYLDRITRVLKELGHEPELFTLSREEEGVIDHDGVRVERIHPRPSPLLRLAWPLFAHRRRFNLRKTFRYLALARAMESALERRHRDKPFDFVQSPGTGFCGRCLRPNPNRPHLIRLSNHRPLWRDADGHQSLDNRLLVQLERRNLRRAERVYAPSRYLAGHVGRAEGLDIAVVRPPVLFDRQPAAAPPPGLPERYLIHFGQIGERKGSALLAEALPKAWEQEPDLTMIWAGKPVRRHSMRDYQARFWGADENRVIFLGQVPKDRLYAILRGAEAAVLPSLVDNLPNTVIESLMLGIPVIGSAGASIDELVEPGRNGDLIPVGDADALASSLVRAWRRESPWHRHGFQPPAVFESMAPAVAAQALLTFAGF